jgi:hypothetical protein
VAPGRLTRQSSARLTEHDEEAQTRERVAQLRDLPRPVKAGLAALAIVGLLVVVALGARGSHPVGHGRVVQRQVPQRVGQDLQELIIALYGLGTIALIVLFYSIRRKWEPVKSHWLRDFALLMAIMSILTFVGYRVIHSPAVRHKAAQVARLQLQQRRAKGKPLSLRQPQDINKSARFDWQFAAAIAGLVALGGAIYFIRVRRRRSPAWIDLDASARDELSVVVGEAIDELLHETDPRRAVIAAYARMELVLGQEGHPRRPAEAPFEYLARILLRLRVRAGAVRELTELFERAKFSTHEIDTSMRERAISALLSVRDDLQAAPA